MKLSFSKPKKKPDAFDKAKPGQKWYYPSTNGVALIAEVQGKNDKAIVARIGKDTIYLEKQGWVELAIPMTPKQAKVYASKRLEDPENSIIYIRYSWVETIIDRFYNWYCRVKKRENTSVIHPISKK